MIKQLISIALSSLSILSIAPDAIAAKEGCRNVNDDVHECIDRRQGPRRVKGYLALKTLQTEPETPRRIKVTRLAGLPKAASIEKGAKNDRSYRGSGRIEKKA